MSDKLVDKLVDELKGRIRFLEIENRELGRRREAAQLGSHELTEQVEKLDAKVASLRARIQELEEEIEVIRQWGELAQRAKDKYRDESAGLREERRLFIENIRQLCDKEMTR